MSPLRIIGYFGLAILGLLDIFILWLSVTKGDLKGLFIGIVFFLLLALFAYQLRNIARQESNPDNAKTQALGWYGVPFRQFFQEVMLKSLEGWLVLVCASLCLLNIVVLIPNWSWASFLLWTVYPWVPFVIWIKLASPDFQARLFSLNSIISVPVLSWFSFMPAKTFWLALTNI